MKMPFKILPSPNSQHDELHSYRQPDIVAPSPMLDIASGCGPLRAQALLSISPSSMAFSLRCRICSPPVAAAIVKPSNPR